MAEQKIFISYSRVDGQQHAIDLAARLRKAQANVWLDQVDIEPGKIWDFEIEKALQSAEAVIFIATEKSTSSNNVLNEVYYALEENKEVIPVIFDNCKMPFRLKRLQYIDFTTGYDIALARLLKSLHLQADDAGQNLQEKNDVVNPPPIEKKIPPPIPDTPAQEIRKDPPPNVQPEHVVAPPINRGIQQNKKSNKTLYWIIGGVVVLLLALAGMYGGNNPSYNRNAYPPIVNNGPDSMRSDEDPLASKAKASNKPRLHNGWRTFTQGNYGIQYPPNWDLDQNPGMGTSFVLYSRLEDAHDAFRENVSLMVQNIAGRNVDLDKFVIISEEQVKTMQVNGVLVDSKRIDDGQYPHHRIIFNSDPNPYHLTTEQYYWVFDQYAYVLTLRCEQSKFSGYQQVGEQILNSFYFK